MDDLERVGRTVKRFCAEIDCQKTWFYDYLKPAGLVKTVKIGGKVIVTTDPAELLDRFAREQAGKA